jgi:hypothetical protein
MSSYTSLADRNSADAAPAAPFRALFASLSGAPLDFIKTAAAFFMVLDHWNTIILARGEVWLFRWGRIAFPLFCLAVAAHVVRDRDARGKSLSLLLVFAVATQPFYSWAFQTIFGNVLWTLAAAGAVAAFMPTLHPLLRHLLFAAGLAAFWLVPNYANAPSDYGIGGMLFPAAIALTAIVGPTYLPWVILYAGSVNAIPQVDMWAVFGGRAGAGWWVEPAIDAGFALIGSAAVVLVSLLFAGRPRFLPKYALHAFYPGHIALLAAIRTLLPLLPR